MGAMLSSEWPQVLREWQQLLLPESCLRGTGWLPTLGMECTGEQHGQHRTLRAQTDPCSWQPAREGSKAGTSEAQPEGGGRRRSWGNQEDGPEYTLPFPEASEDPTVPAPTDAPAPGQAPSQLSISKSQVWLGLP